MTSHKDINFSELREVYRYFFSYILSLATEEGVVLNEPQRLEIHLAKHQVDLFEPFFNKHAVVYTGFQDYVNRQIEKEQRARRPAVFKPLQLYMSVIGVVRDRLRMGEPGLIGCHYRSIGLETLRNSKYWGTPAFWERVNRYTDQNTLRDSEETKTKLHDSLLRTYFELFSKAKTLNQQMFNADHPLGPIGFLFLTPQRIRELSSGFRSDPSTLSVGEVLGDEYDLIDRLRAPLLGKQEDLLAAYYAFGQSGYDSRWKELKDNLARCRSEVEKDIRARPAWQRVWEEKVSSFFDRKIPRSKLSRSIGDVLTMFQSYLVYGHLAGNCVYTFPTTVQPNLPTCGFTLMCKRPIDNETCEMLQRISEMIYGELFSTTIASNYRQFFNLHLLESRSRRTDSLDLLGEEKYNMILASTLAETPIPIKALDTFLSFTRKLPRMGAYERKPFGFFLVLTHQEFLESFLDRLEGYTHELNRRPQEIFFAGDDSSIEVAAHGMRVNFGKRNSPDHALFFVYPPFDPNTFLLDSVLPLEQFEDAAKERGAILLSDVVPMQLLRASERLRYKYLRQFDREISNSPEDVEDVAEALTLGNRELIVILYEPSQQMKLFFDGSCLFETKLHHWELPAKSADDFIRALRDRINKFLSLSKATISQEDEKTVTQTLVRFLKEQSRRFHGTFLIFHPEKRPEDWPDLDVATSRGDQEQGRSWSLLEGDFFKRIDDFWQTLREASATDGAVVLTMEEGRLQLYSGVVVAPTSKDVDVFMMRGLQAKKDFPPLRSFGTKHNAAYEYAMAFDQGFAITVSGDGPVTLFHQETFKDGAFTRRYPEMEEKKLRKAVAIVRM